MRGFPEPDPKGEGLWLDQDWDNEAGIQWYVVRSVSRCLEMLQKYEGEVNILSLDHDLGCFEDGREITGYHVLCWLEEQQAMNPKYPLPKFIRLHSSNPSAVAKMRLARENIYGRG